MVFQLGVLLPAGRGQVAAPGAGRGVGVGAQVPRRRRLLPEERPGGRPPRAVARPRHRRRPRVRRQRRHLLRLRACPALHCQRRRPQAGHGGQVSQTGPCCT
ncbi:Mitochondrial arginine transporter BAC2 [Zea mays]|uniref:Mitochondrial arginine transporter BAC2 n=1 Tax=Zea mays TaxID=4577 RepID=A0A1D6FGX4_MAIZE|nr:Mitochondrial arginine transporter BAC2 [Zea mays]